MQALNLITTLRNLKRYSKYASVIPLNYLAHRGLVANFLLFELVKNNNVDNFANILKDYLLNLPNGDIPRAIKEMLGIADENKLPIELQVAKDKADAIEVSFLVMPERLAEVDPTFPKLNITLDQLNSFELNLSKYLTIVRFNNGDIPVNNKRISLAEHIAETLILALIDDTGVVSKYIDSEAEFNRLLQILAVHDLMELYTADIPTPIKVKMEAKVRELEYMVFVELERANGQKELFEYLRQILNVNDTDRVIDEFGLMQLERYGKLDRVRLIAKYFDIYSLYVEAITIGAENIANEAWNKMENILRRL